MADGGIRGVPINLHLQVKQALAFLSLATEILYGGSAFGGKSFLMRCAAIMWCTEIPGLMVYIFRRVEDDLVKNHIEGPHGFRAMLEPWIEAGLVEMVQSEIRFKFNGAKIFLCHCKDEEHRFKYIGAEIHVLLIDELTTFSELIYRFLRSRVRMVGINLPEKYRAGQVGPSGEVNEWNLFPRIVNGSNPGNIGHHWVKRTWGLDTAGMLKPTRMGDLEGGMVRQYVPARLDDNPIGTSEDPTYVSRLRGLGDPALVRAMELGDWNIIAGGFFPEFSLERHVLRAASLPDSIFTRRFRAHDWGSAKPFSTGWYGIAEDPWETEGTLGNPITVPRGAIVRYREWYGMQPDQDNVGLRLPVETWAKGVLKRSGNETFQYDVADPSMFSSDGGPSLAERAAKQQIKAGNDIRKMSLRRADNKRVGPMGHGIGWDQVRLRLRGEDGDEDTPGTPLLYLMDNQPQAIRIMQAVQHDDLKPEDLDTDAEDHAVDEIRYGCMSRPRATMKPGSNRPRGPKHGTMAWLDKMQGVRGNLYDMEE